MMTPKFVIHLLSGGLDSTVMLYDLQAQGCKMHCLLFDYGQTHKRELNYAKRHCWKLGVPFTTIDLPQRLRGSKLTDDKNGWVVPFRNPILLGMAVNLAVSAEADCVTIACNADDAAMFPDCRRPVIDELNSVVKLCGYQVEICAPYIDKPKWAIADLGRQLGVDLADTWSCYAGGELPCGECPACIKRKTALEHK